MGLLTKFRRAIYSIRYVVNVRKPLLLLRIAKACFKTIFAPWSVLRGVDIVLGYDCNLKCSHCNVTRMKKKDVSALSMDEYRELKKDLDRLSVFSYTFTGGEPLIYEKFEELVKLFDPRRNVVILQTNGTLLTKERLVGLKKLGVDIVDISIDSFSDTEHDANRGKDGTLGQAIKVYFPKIKRGYWNIKATRN